MLLLCRIREKETIVNQLLQEVEQCKKEIVSLSKDLDCQKEKNRVCLDLKYFHIIYLLFVENCIKRCIDLVKN